jgi:uncharacterized membrane protein
MNKILVTVFDTEAAAYEGLRALKDLHKAGDITVYATAVIVKDSAGNVSVKQAADGGPIGTGLGVLTGSLLGMIGGPIGMAVGAAAGGLAGLAYDVATAEVGKDFLAEVSGALAPDKAAVLAEVDEFWVTPVDVRMAKLGGTVLRRQRSDVVADQLNRDAAELDAELTALEAEMDQAAAESRAALQARVDSTRQKLDALDKQVEAKQAEVAAEMNAKIEALREQAKTATNSGKARAEQRLTEVEADYEARRAKLDQAHKLIREALDPKAGAK